MIDLENKIGVLDLDFSNNELFKIEAYTENSKSGINSNVVNSAVKITYIPTDQFIIVDGKISQFQNAQITKDCMTYMLTKCFYEKPRYNELIKKGLKKKKLRSKNVEKIW